MKEKLKRKNQRQKNKKEHECIQLKQTKIYHTISHR
jgi:hypothetical protein